MRNVAARVLFTALAVFWAGTAGATTITFENTLAATGTIAYGGALGTPMTGTDITFDRVTYGLTSLTCVGCELDFTTGNSTSETGTQVDFAGPGSFVIMGSVFDGATLVASGTLLSGTFAEASAREGAAGLIRATGTGFDRKNPDLLSYLGLLEGTYVFSTLNVSAVGCDTTVDNGFSCAVSEADVTNDFLAVPDSGSTVAFLGLGLLVVGLVSRKVLV